MPIVTFRERLREERKERRGRKEGLVISFQLFSQHRENTETTCVRTFLLKLVHVILGPNISSVDRTDVSNIPAIPRESSQMVVYRKGKGPLAC